MKEKLYSRRGTIIIYGTLAASVIVAVLSVISLLAIPVVTTENADMRIEPSQGQVVVGDTFTIQVVVDAAIPVNVFRGEVLFDPHVLFVDSIDYNTSIADLWAELPWYENGEGTVNFAGGTTRKGGFTGTGSLITITFKTRAHGNTVLRLDGARILEHNGLGTDVELDKPIDAIFAVAENILAEESVATPDITTVELAVTPKAPSTDINGDGKQTLADVSSFMLNMFGGDLRFDFNMDGTVNQKDMSIIMSAQ